MTSDLMENSVWTLLAALDGEFEQHPVHGGASCKPAVVIRKRLWTNIKPVVNSIVIQWYNQLAKQEQRDTAGPWWYQDIPVMYGDMMATWSAGPHPMAPRDASKMPSWLVKRGVSHRGLAHETMRVTNRLGWLLVCGDYIFVCELFCYDMIRVMLIVQISGWTNCSWGGVLRQGQFFAIYWVVAPVYKVCNVETCWKHAWVRCNNPAESTWEVCF